MLVATIRSGKGAVDCARRAEHEAGTARDVAGQRANNDAWLRWRRPGQCQSRAKRRDKCGGEPISSEHRKPPCAASIHELEISAKLRQRLTRCGAQQEKSCQPNGFCNGSSSWP